MEKPKIGRAKIESTPQIREKIDEIIQLAGGQRQLAKRVGVSQTAVWFWVKKGVIPAERVMDVCHAVEWKVRPQDLFPKVYLPPREEES